MVPRSNSPGSSSPAALAAKLQTALKLHQQGQLQRAEGLYREILKQQPRHFDALHFLGVAALQVGNAQATVDLISKAIAVNPGSAAAHYNFGIALHNLGRSDEALASFDRALAISPDYADALNNRGIALHALNRCEEALATFDRTLAIRPGSAETFYNRGTSLQSLRRTEEALASYEQALAIRPDYAEALSNRGLTLQHLHRTDEALASFERALAVSPDSAEILNNLGITLQSCGRTDDALASYARALAINPENLEALNNCGGLLDSLKRYEEARTCYERILRARPDYPFVFGNWLLTKIMICDWTELSAGFEEHLARIDAGKPVAPPFALLTTPASRLQQRNCAAVYVQERFHLPASPLAGGARPAHHRIRIGYFSANFHDTATANLIAGVFERHDRQRFELIAFSFGVPSRDAMRARLEAAFDRFIDVREKSDAEIAQLSRTLEIDIAVDLKGFTQDSRTEIFIHRAAPLQVIYLGYPGTTGAHYIDYLIADQTIIPPEHVDGYAEKIAYLPHSYQANDGSRMIADRQFTRPSVGLPERGFVFCCFNNNYKITPGVFDIWMRLLQKTGGSVLWLLEDNPAAARNLRTEAQQRGIAAERLVFAPRMTLPEHLARHRLADLFLDTLPCNAHTTASDALWAGLPVVTCLGETFAGRVAASLVRAVGLPELVTESLDAYEALAMELANDPAALAVIRQRLAKNRLKEPLFDTPLFTRHLEGAFTAMWERHQSGMPPENIVIPPSTARSTG